MTNSGRGDQYYENNRKIFYDKSSSYDQGRSYNKNNQNFRGRNNFRDDGIEVNIVEVIEEILRIETGHIAEVKAGIETKGADLEGIEKIVV